MKLSTLTNKQLSEEFERAWKNWRGAEDELGLRRIERFSDEIGRREATGRWTDEEWKG